MKHLKRFNEDNDLDRHTGYDEEGHSLNSSGNILPLKKEEEGKLPLSVTIDISQGIIDTCIKFGIHEETIEEVFKGYLDHILGYNTHGDDGFEDWLEDNADDWVN